MTRKSFDKRRFVLPAIVGLLASALALAISASAQAMVTPWGELGIAHLAEGTGPGQVDLERATGFAVDPNDGSYYVADELDSTTLEYRIQRFNSKGEVEASISFVPPPSKSSATGSDGVEIQLAVDPERERVYALVVYERRGEPTENEEKALEKEEKELEKEGKTCKEVPHACYTRFPLDHEEYAAGALYAFEYTGGQLVAAKTSSGAPAPILSEGALKDQGETPKEALLNPHGAAVDPATGDVVITGNEDNEENVKVEREESPQHCLDAAQLVTVQGKSGDLSGKLGARFVDDKEVFQSLECGVKERDESVPYSPVITAGGTLLAEQRPEGGETDIWEVPESEVEANRIGETAGIKEYASAPRVLYAHPELQRLVTFEPEGVVGPTMSFVPAAESTEGKLYMTAEVASKEGSGEAPTDAVLVLDYSEAGAIPEATESGWIGGAHEAGGGAEGCLLPRPSGLAFLVGGFRESATGKEGVVGFDAFEHEKVPVIDALQFGPGGNTTGCPHASLTPPSVEVKGVAVKKLVPHEGATFSSTLEAANAVSVEWKFENATSHKTETVAGKGYEYQTTSIEHTFTEGGEYNVTEIVQTDNLAYPLVEGTLKDAFTVVVAKPKFTIEGKTVLENETEASFDAEVSDENREATPLKYVWSFGDGEKQEGETQGTATKILAKHTYHKPCSCTVTLEVLDRDGGSNIAQQPVTVTEDKEEVEAEAERKAKEEAERKATEETERKAKEEAERKAKEEAEHKVGQEKGNVGGGSATESPPEARLASSAVTVSAKGALSVQVSCPSGDTSCAGTVTLRTAGAVSARSHKKSKKAVLTLASGLFSVSGGHTTAVTLHLSAKALSLLQRSHSLRASAVVTAHDPAGASQTTQSTVTLRLSKSSHGHRH
jgi:hypothetical protein